jgi:hypothetical protein
MDERDHGALEKCRDSAAFMKKKQKKVALPRRQWQINPVTRMPGKVRVRAQAASSFRA